MSRGLLAGLRILDLSVWRPGPHATQLLAELGAEADVVVEGFRPSVADRLGVGYEAIRGVNPSIEQHPPNCHSPSPALDEHRGGGFWPR